MLEGGKASAERIVTEEVSCYAPMAQDSPEPIGKRYGGIL